MRHLYKLKCAILSTGREFKRHVVPRFLSLLLYHIESSCLRSSGRIFILKFNMGCCFSKDLIPNPLSERASLLQTSVTESCSDQDVKKYSSVAELAEEKHPEYGQTNRGVDFRSDASSTTPSASLTSVNKRSSSMQDGAVVCGKFKDYSRNKPLGDISKDSDVQAQTETAVLNSVKRRIAENAVKRANWFCEVDLSQHADSTRFKNLCENTAVETLVPNGRNVRPLCTSDDANPGLSPAQKQERGHSKNSISQKSGVFITTKYLYDGLLDSDEKRSDLLTSQCSVKRRTQSFYSICSIDADDLGAERDPTAVTLPAAFHRSDLLTNTETKVFLNTPLSNAALEAVNGSKEIHKDDEMVVEGLPAETLALNTAHMLPDIIGTFREMGSDEDVASEKRVSVLPEDGVKDKREKHGHRSRITGLHKTVNETIPDLLDRNERLRESVLDHTDMDCSCQTRANTNAELNNVSKLEATETGCEGHCSETPAQEQKRVSSESRTLDNKENHLNGCVNCREENLGMMAETGHEPVPCSHVEPHNDSVQDFLCSKISSMSQIMEDKPSSFLTSSIESESDVKSRGVVSESSSWDADTLNLNSKSCLSLGKDRVLEPGESICSFAEREAVATDPEPRCELSLLQRLNSFTSEISGGNTATPGWVDYPGFDTCVLLTPHDAENGEVNFGMEDVTCHISSTELAAVAPESETGHERVATSENSVRRSSKADGLLEANQSLVKAFSENSMILTLMKQEFSRKEGEGCCLKESETLTQTECFNEHTVEGPRQISLSTCHVKTPEMELQKSMGFDLAPGRNNDEQVIHLFLEGSSENAALSIYSSPHAEPPDTFESTMLSKNGAQCESAHIPTHSLLGKTDTPSSSDLSSQEPELAQGVHVIRTAEQQVVIDYRVPIGRTIKPVFETGEPALEGHDSSDEGIECFMTSRLQGYQLADGLHVSGSSCGLGTAGMYPVPKFSEVNKAIPVPIEPNQVDLYASMPSYEIHFPSPNTDTELVQVESPQSLTSTNESERERGVLNMVSDLLGKSEVNEDGDCSRFLSVWAAELESVWQYRLSEEELMGQSGQEEGKADSALDSEVFTAAYPYSLLVSDGACVWDWQLVSLCQCCVVS